ncbi:MAG: hypothetical protein ACKO5P_00210 [Nodosilinea sp.]
MANSIRQSLSIHYQQQQVSPAPGMATSWPQPGDDRACPPALPASPPSLRAAVLAGGSMVAAAVLGLSPHPAQMVDSQVMTGECIKLEKIENSLSRDRLKALLGVQTPAPRATLQALLKVPYCVLKPTTDGQGVAIEREAYPLEFDPQTWVVITYQGDRYTGYDFLFRP